MLSLEDINRKESKVEPFLKSLFTACKENEMDVAVVFKFDENTMGLRTLDNGLIRFTGHDVPPSWTIE